MDFIQNKINQRIDLAQMSEAAGNLGVYYRSRIEYLLIMTLGYLWNRNFESLSEDDKLDVFGRIVRPTIGDIVYACRVLDVNKEIFGYKRVSQSIDSYPEIRNKYMGHGFTYDDARKEIDKSYVDLYDTLVSEPQCLLGQDFDYVFIQQQGRDIYKGIRFGSDGTINVWSCPIQLTGLEVSKLYIVKHDIYTSVTPFVKIQDVGDSVYVYSKIKEKLTGLILYNKLISTGELSEEWEPFSNLSVVNDGTKIKTANGTIRNIYENNYKTYIDVGVTSQILKFLKDNKSSVCATLWGHGGIGKTATIQSVCDTLANKEYKTFDYIVFISAKDRRYNYYKGIIEEIGTDISTYSEVITCLNKILFDEETSDEHRVLQYDGKLLLVLDDFETFAKEEASRISEFITSLDINHHKVVVTTRSANVFLGLEIKTNELDVAQSSAFLESFIQNEGIPLSQEDRNLLKKDESKKRVHEITSGRPLFISQLGHIIGRNGLSKALSYDIKKEKPAIEFLYGRIYDYLSSKAKDLFVVMGMLASDGDMINVLGKAQYIMNMENDDAGFNSAVEELKKLKIVKISDEENRFFEVYSREILEMMIKRFQMRDATFIKNCNTRLSQVNKDKDADIEQSLLNNANAARLIKNEIEVIDSYKQILNRSTSPLSIKLAAIFNLANYLLVDRGKRNDALDVYDKNSHLFTGFGRGHENRVLYAKFSLRWASAYWSNGTDLQKKKAIAILSDYYKGKIDYHSNIDIEITSTLLMFRSLMVIKEWRELKDKNHFNEIPLTEFKLQREEQIKECHSLLTYIGNPLYINVSKKKLIDFPSGTRQSLITAFINYTDVLTRIQKKELAMEICDYVIATGPNNFKTQFSAKKAWLISITR